MHGAHSRLATSFCAEWEKSSNIPVQENTTYSYAFCQKDTVYIGICAVQTNLTKLLEIDFDRGPVE